MNLAKEDEALGKGLERSGTGSKEDVNVYDVMDEVIEILRMMLVVLYCANILRLACAEEKIKGM